ncbi:uncharacterized protein N7503_008952 [Penicillium pulvis]|uniref:uncharacterized protein n=1 Tax=Penicillium pulvis TaxID=1562058 RepID=UPI0025465E76|nr:uncharacterized protein N7503_008952 [Penicillium pulvis]KAJ5792974.1 hypothetical protein N7503_008952 [Penicillium pulvis]
MKFTGFTFSVAIAGIVSAAALPTIPGRTAVGGIENSPENNAANNVEGTLGALKRDGGDAASGLVYGVTGATNGATGIIGSAAGTAESTSSGLVGTAESTVSGAVPAKRQEGGVIGSLEDTLGALKRDGGDAVSGLVYGVTESTNGATGIVGSAAGTAESTSSGLVGTAESTVSGAVPAKRQEGGVIGSLEDTLGALKRDGGDAVSGLVYGVTELTNGATGIVGSAAGTAESTSSGLVGTAESTVAGAVPAKRQLPGAGNIVKASVENDLAMLSGNPSGLIGALGGLQGALATGGILPSQISSLPAELQLVVGYLYTA